MTGSLQIAVTAVGGLALFIYGMGLMSDGLRETARSKLKAVLGYMTKNRFFAIAAGAWVTALIQSSSATSVMTVGFVNAGLLSLQQAGGIRSAARMATLELWNGQQSRGAHTRESLALVSVFKCLGDISRHIGNIAVRARGGGERRLGHRRPQ